MALILGNKILSVGVVCFLTIGCSDNAGSYTSYSSDSKAGTTLTLVVQVTMQATNGQAKKVLHLVVETLVLLLQAVRLT